MNQEEELMKKWKLTGLLDGQKLEKEKVELAANLESTAKYLIANKDTLSQFVLQGALPLVAMIYNFKPTMFISTDIVVGCLNKVNTKECREYVENLPHYCSIDVEAELTYLAADEYFKRIDEEYK
jgi:hypothetical protein